MGAGDHEQPGDKCSVFVLRRPAQNGGRVVSVADSRVGAEEEVGSRRSLLGHVVSLGAVCVRRNPNPVGAPAAPQRPTACTC